MRNKYLSFDVHFCMLKEKRCVSPAGEWKGAWLRVTKHIFRMRCFLSAFVLVLSLCACSSVQELPAASSAEEGAVSFMEMTSNAEPETGSQPLPSSQGGSGVQVGRETESASGISESAQQKAESPWSEIQSSVPSESGAETGSGTASGQAESVQQSAEEPASAAQSAVQEEQGAGKKENAASAQSGDETVKEETEMKLQIGNTVLTAVLAENDSARALAELLRQGPLTIAMEDYGRMEKVGDLGTSLPRCDESITTSAGDLILYQGSSFVIYYAQNSWSLTRLGRIQDVTADGLREILGNGDVTVTLSLA